MKRKSKKPIISYCFHYKKDYLPIVTQCQFVRCGAHRWKHIIFLGDGADYNEISYNNTFDDLVGQGIGAGGSGIANKGNHIHHNHINGVVDDGEYNKNLFSWARIHIMKSILTCLLNTI
jgi:hypothetical protein